MESDVIAAGSVRGVFEEKHYNRGVHMHILVMEALFRIKWKKFGQWLTEQENPPAYTSLQDDIKHIQQDVTRASYDRIINNKEYYSLLMNFNEFTLIPNGPMMEFWQSYLDIVDLLLCFVPATREGDWKLHLTCIQNMIPLLMTITVMQGMPLCTGVK